MGKTQKKNEYMTVRDPGEEIRSTLDSIRILIGDREGGLQPTRTDVIRAMAQQELERLKSGNQRKNG